MEIAGKVAVITGRRFGYRPGVRPEPGFPGRLRSWWRISTRPADARRRPPSPPAGGAAAFALVDVRETRDLTAMFDAAAEHFGGIDILVNNAGVVCGQPLWPATSPELLVPRSW